MQQEPDTHGNFSQYFSQCHPSFILEDECVGVQFVGAGGDIPVGTRGGNLLENLSGHFV